jgi:hypothetical protein
MATVVHLGKLGDIVLEEKPLGDGGEAVVWGVERQPGIVVKLWNKVPPFPELLLSRISAITQPVPEVCRILDIAHHYKDGPVIGFAMERVHGGQALTEYKFRTPLERLLTFQRFLRAVHALELRKVFMTDQNFENVLIVPGGVRLIDCDSYSLFDPTLAWPDGTTGPRIHTGGVNCLLPPECRGPSREPFSKYSVYHQEALVGWRCLKDEMPWELVDLDGKPVPDSEKRFLEDYQCGRFFDHGPWTQPVDKGIPWAELPERVQTYFDLCFSEKGLRYRFNRPSTADWLKVITDWIDRLPKRRPFPWRAAAAVAAGVAFGGAAWALAPKPAPPAVEQKTDKPTKDIPNNRPLLWSGEEAK